MARWRHSSWDLPDWLVIVLPETLPLGYVLQYYAYNTVKHMHNSK